MCFGGREVIVVDRMSRQVLDTMAVRQLLEYIDAYGIAKDMPPVEKADVINAILETDLTDYNEEVSRVTSTPNVDLPTRHTGISRLVQGLRAKPPNRHRLDRHPPPKDHPRRPSLIYLLIRKSKRINASNLLPPRKRLIQGLPSQEN
jgi:hypothetical protein